VQYVGHDRHEQRKNEVDDEYDQVVQEQLIAKVHQLNKMMLVKVVITNDLMIRHLYFV
jgi:hypothetical protein